MPRNYTKGLKQRPGGKAGEAFALAVTEASFAHPLLVPVAEPVTLKPLSIAFVDIPDASARTCLGARARKTDDIATAQHFSWAGINHYYLWSCNATIRKNTLDAVRAAGLRVIRVFLLSTTGQGSVAACSDTPTPDLEPHAVGLYDDAILVYSGDNGGCPQFGAYNYPLRGMKNFLFEGGLRVHGWVHSALLPRAELVQWADEDGDGECVPPRAPCGGAGSAVALAFTRAPGLPAGSTSRSSSWSGAPA